MKDAWLPVLICVGYVALGDIAGCPKPNFITCIILFYAVRIYVNQEADGKKESDG